MYYVNDGVYGSFNRVVFDHSTVIEPKILKDVDKGAMFSSSIWGPSCDSMDCITKSVMLPKVRMSLFCLLVVNHQFMKGHITQINIFTRAMHKMWSLVKLHSGRLISSFNRFGLDDTVVYNLSLHCSCDFLSLANARCFTSCFICVCHTVGRCLVTPDAVLVFTLEAKSYCIWWPSLIRKWFVSMEFTCFNNHWSV